MWKRNHHNKVRCAKCGLCLRAGKAGKLKVKKSGQKISLPVGRLKLMCCVPLVDTLMMFGR